MTPEELKLLVKVDVSTLENVTGLQDGEILFYDTTTPENKLKKMSIDTFNNLSKTAKPLKPTDPSPTAEGLYKPTISGTYDNAGGLIAQDGYDTLFFFDGSTWTKSETKLMLDLAQSTGNSTTKSMSQNAITNEILPIKDSFTSEVVDISIYKVNPVTEIHGSAVLAGFGQSQGVVQNFTKVKIKTRATNNSALPTKVKLRIREEVYNATPILEKEITTDFTTNTTQTLEWTFPNVANSAGKNLWFEYIGVDGQLAFIGDTSITGANVMYTTTLNGSVMNANSTSAGRMNIDIFREGAKLTLKESALPIIQTIPEVEVILPDKIQAVVGDKLQLFYRGIIKAVNPYNYDILITCAKGKSFKRYFELTPVVGDIGNHNFTVTVKDNLGNVIASKTSVLEIKSAGSSPSSQINILAVGDSTTGGGEWVTETQRRLSGTGGNPTGKGFTNINFRGRKTNATAGWEGNGGWIWFSYSSAAQGNAYRFTVTGVVTAPSLGAVYTHNGGTYTIDEINLTSGSGNIRGTMTGTAPSASGILTKTSGSGDTTITFSTSAIEPSNPFWNSSLGRLDFTTYVNNYMGGDLDAAYFLLSWNGQAPNRTNFDAEKLQARKIFDQIHIEFPNAKIKLMGIQLPSLNGGLGENYGANGGYADAYGMVVTALNQNKAYQDLANESAYSGFVEFVNISAQFDSENNMPEADTAVNSRSSKTEKRGINGVHPALDGYYQIADAVYRNAVSRFCQ